MFRLDPQRMSALAVAWVGSLSIAILVTLGEAFPFRLSFVRPETFLTWFVRAELLFAVFFWPLLLRGLVREGCAALGSLAAWGLLMALAVPLAAVAANLSAATAGQVCAGQILVAASAAPAAAVQAAARKRGWTRAGAWYFLGALVLSALPPFLHFLVREVEGTGDLSGFRWVSPFWAAAEAPLGAAAALGALALAGFGADALLWPRAPEEKA